MAAILVVEDYWGVRDFLTAAFSDAGYEAVSAHRLGEAVQCWTSSTSMSSWWTSCSSMAMGPNLSLLRVSAE
jgi:CheY-like chemotaxis protein